MFITSNSKLRLSFFLTISVRAWNQSVPLHPGCFPEYIPIPGHFQHGGQKRFEGLDIRTYLNYHFFFLSANSALSLLTTVHFKIYIAKHTQLEAGSEEAIVSKNKFFFDQPPVYMYASMY